jgi:membrane protease YdiL (CAAX protease family)
MNELNESAPISPPAATPALPVTRPVKPRVWTVFATWMLGALVGEMAVVAGFVTVGVFIGATLGAQGVDAATIQTRVQEFIQRPLPALLLSLIPFQLGLLSVVLFAAWRSPTPLKERLGLVTPTGDVPNGLQRAGLAAFTVSTALGLIVLTSIVLGPPPADTAIANIITDGSWMTLTLVSIILSIIPALVEEIAFRGYIQRRLLQRWSPRVAIGVSSILFALLHADSLQHVIAVVPLAVVTGVLAFRSNSIRPGMLVHAIHNTAAVGLGALMTALTPQLGEDGVGMLLLGVIVALGLLGLPATIALFRRRPAKTIGGDQAVELPLPSFLTDSALVRQLG